jgi:hypothetical protein
VGKKNIFKIIGAFAFVLSIFLLPHRALADSPYTENYLNSNLGTYGDNMCYADGGCIIASDSGITAQDFNAHGLSTYSIDNTGNKFDVSFWVYWDNTQQFPYVCPFLSDASKTWLNWWDEVAGDFFSICLTPTNIGVGEMAVGDYMSVPHGLTTTGIHKLSLKYDTGVLEMYLDDVLKGTTNLDLSGISYYHPTIYMEGGQYLISFEDTLSRDVDGGWTDWGGCSLSCGGGTQTRTCTNPAPHGSGSDCVGDSEQSCNTFACPVMQPLIVNGQSYTDWTDDGYYTYTQNITLPLDHYTYQFTITGDACIFQDVGNANTGSIQFDEEQGNTACFTAGTYTLHFTNTGLDWQEVYGVDPTDIRVDPYYETYNGGVLSSIVITGANYVPTNPSISDFNTTNPSGSALNGAVLGASTTAVGKLGYVVPVGIGVLGATTIVMWIVRKFTLLASLRQ